MTCNCNLNGGMALTAEQVEDVEALVATANPYSVPAARLRALFPATEPAEDAKPCGSNSVTLGWCKLTARHEGLHTNGTYLWGTPSEPDPPAPAEPAEEELGLPYCRAPEDGWECTEPAGHDGRHVATNRKNGSVYHSWPAKEETNAQRCPFEIEGWGCSLTNGHDGDHTAYDQDGPAYVWPASSPVVPAPTETGPWPSLDAVPAHVRTVRDNVGDEYRRAGNGGWDFRSSEWQQLISPTTEYAEFAPFVAAEEG